MPADPKADLLNTDPFEEDISLDQIEREVASILDTAAAQPATAQPAPPAEQRAYAKPAPGKEDLLPVGGAQQMPEGDLVLGQDRGQAVPIEEPKATPSKPSTPKKAAAPAAQPKPDPMAQLRKYATMNGRKAFIDYLEKDEAAQQAWFNSKASFRKTLIKSWIDAEAKRFAREAAKAVDLKKLKPAQRRRFYKRLEDRRKADLLQQLTPLIGINTASVLNDPLADPNTFLTKTLRRNKLPASKEELYGWLQTEIQAIKDKWQAAPSDEHKKLLKSLQSKYLLQARRALQATPEYQRMKQKDRNAALKALKETVQLQFEALAPEVIGNWDLAKDPKKAVKEAINTKAAEDPDTAGIMNYAAITLGSATAGVGDLIAFSGDVLSYVTGDGSWRDMALAKIGRDIADWGRKVQESNTPEHVKQELAQLSEKLKNGQIVDAFSGLSPAAYAVVGTQMLGYIAGSGGLAGGARAAAVRLATAKSIGAGLRANRIAKVLSTNKAKAATIAAGTGGAQGAEAGTQVAQTIAEAPIDELKATPGWAMMVRNLTAATGRAPTDAEVRKALADLHASRASVHGAAVSTAATLLLGGITENMLGALPTGFTRQLFPAMERTGGRIASAAKAAPREGLSEFVEEGGLQTAQQIEISAATGRPVDSGEIIAAGLAGAGFGALFGGAIGAATPVAKGGDGTQGSAAAAQAAKDNLDNDPDIAEAKDEAAAQALDSIRVSNEKAGNTPPKELADVFSGPVQPGVVEFVHEANDNEIKLATIAGDDVKKVGEDFFYGEKKIDPEDPYWRSIIAEAEQQAGVAPGTFYNPQPATKPTTEQKQIDKRSVEALDVPEEIVADVDTALDQRFEEEVVGSTEQPGTTQPPQEVAPPPGMDQGDLARAFVHMLVKSGEPEVLAVESAIKTFGRKVVPDDVLETYKDIDPDTWAKEIEPLQPRADAKHVAEIKAALPAKGRYYVVVSAAEMPGMNPNAAIASFNFDGGKEAFVVVNAAAIKSKQHLQQVFTAHHAMRALVSPRSGDVLLKAAIKAVNLGMHLRVTKPTKKGYIDYTPEHPIPNLKSPKTTTAMQIMRAFQERLRRGDKEAMRGLKEAVNELLEEQGLPKIGRYVSYSQLWRTLLEAGVIPRSDLADIAAAPPGSTPPPRNTLPGTDKDGGDGKKGAQLQAPKGITHEGFILKLIGLADNASKLNTLMSWANEEGVDTDVREKVIEFVNAARSQSSVISDYYNFLSGFNYKLDIVTKQVAKETGLDIDDVKAKYNEYRIARHAIERNRSLWAELVPLGKKGAEAQRAAIITAMFDGSLDPKIGEQQLIDLARNSDPAIPLEEAVYGGMNNEDAKAIIDTIEAQGLAEPFAKIDAEYDVLVDRMLWWEEQAGTYAGPAKNILLARGWKYYTPLFDTKEKNREFDEKDTEDVVHTLFNPVNIVKKTADGRRTIENVDIWANFEVAARNAAYRAALARTTRAMRSMTEETDKKGFTAQLAKIEEVGRVEFKPGVDGKPPSWHIPVNAAVKNPRVFNVYNPDTGKWERLTVYDKDIAKLLRNQLGEDFIFGSRVVDKFMRSVGDLTRWFAKGMTAYNPQYWFTASYRDLVQTTVLLASQKGLNPAKAATTISKRLASMGQSKYTKAFFKFLAADAKVREEMANDPEFMSIPGMDKVVERWRQGGFITFTAQVGEAETRATRGRGAIATALRRKLREQLGTEGYLAIEHKLQTVENIGMLLDNIHRQVAYDMLRESGASPAEAALWSRDIMDFNKRGDWGTRLNQVWAFANAGLIGATTVLSNHIWKNGTMPVKTEVGPNGDVVVKFDNDPRRIAKELNWGAVGYFVLSGAMRTALIAYLLGDDDDGEPVARKISPGTWFMYEVWPFSWMPGFDGPIKLPKQYGLHQLFDGVGTALALKGLGIMDWEDMKLPFTEMLGVNIIPVGRLTFPASMTEGGTFNTGDFVKQQIVNFAPTAISGISALTLGMDTFGQKLNPEVQFTRAAGYTKSFIGTPQLYQDIAEFAYKNLGLDATPEQVQVFVRDVVPMVGPAFDGIMRLGVNMLSRPDRTFIEELFSSNLTPLPKVAYDLRYDYVRVNQRIRYGYIQPVAKAIDTIRAQFKHNPAEMERRLRQIYRENPWYRPVMKLNRNYAERKAELRQAVRAAREVHDYETASQKWREYNELRKRIVAETVQIMKTHGVDIDY